MTRRRAVLIAGLLTAIAVAVTALVLLARPASPRSGAAPQATPSPATSVRIVVPGRPGESAVVTGSVPARAPDVYNQADRTFMQMMIPHHEQAVRIAALAPDRAADPRIKALADRVRAAQGAEVPVMRAWLDTRRIGPGEHDHATMPGMQSEADLAALGAARGTGFDRRFVTMLTAHHEGALTMARDVLAAGADPTVAKLARDISAEQTAEIARMADLRLP